MKKNARINLLFLIFALFLFAGCQRETTLTEEKTGDALMVRMADFLSKQKADGKIISVRMAEKYLLENGCKKVEGTQFHREFIAKKEREFSNSARMAPPCNITSTFLEAGDGCTIIMWEYPSDCWYNPGCVKNYWFCDSCKEGYCGEQLIC